MPGSPASVVQCATQEARGKGKRIEGGQAKSNGREYARHLTQHQYRLQQRQAYTEVQLMK